MVQSPVMMSFEVFEAIIHSKTEKRRIKKGFKRVTKPNMKKAYKALTTNPTLIKMSDDQRISYFVGWFLLE